MSKRPRAHEPMHENSLTLTQQTDNTSERDSVTHWHWPPLLHACRGTLLTRRISLEKEQVVGMARLMLFVEKQLKP
jgi:hypothetical protein